MASKSLYTDEKTIKNVKTIHLNKIPNHPMRQISFQIQVP